MPSGRDSPRVFHVVLSLECGGMEQVVVDLVQLARKQERAVDVLCLERPGELAPQVLAAGATVHCLNKAPGLQLGLRKEIASLLKRVEPDIVHTHQIGALFYSGPVAARHVKPVLHTEHGKEYNGRRRTRWLGRFAARYATRFCCVSEDTAAHVCHHRIVTADRIDIVYNGIDIDRFRTVSDVRDKVREELEIPRGAFLIGTVGRLAGIKRQDVLLRAFADLHHKNHNSHLVLIGDGPQQGVLADLVQSLGLSDSTHFLGYQKSPERYLAAMDLFALTSDSEGTPLALLEAWAMGLPVVVTAVGGLPELVKPNKTGKLVPAGDVPALAAVFQELSADEAQCKLLGAGGKADVCHRFSRDVMASRYDSLYQQLLNPKE